MRPANRRRTSTIAAIALLAVFGLTGSGCPPGQGPLFATYVAQTPYLSNVGPNVQECSNAYYVSGGGTATLPFEVDLTTTLNNNIIITKTVSGQTSAPLPTLNPGPVGVLPPYTDSYYALVASIDPTYPLEYLVVDIYPNTGTGPTPPQQLATYSIAETNSYGTSQLLAFNVQWGQAPPSGCWLAPRQPAPTNLSTAPVGGTVDFLLQFSSPAWQTGGNLPSCSSPDTFEIQISSDQTFRLPVRSLTLVSGVTQPSGAPGYPSIPGGTTDQTFNALSRWNFICTYGGGTPPTFNFNVNPFTLSFGAITAPDVTYTSSGTANPLFFRVRGEYYGAIGPWSQPASFNVPPPTQNLNSGVDTCSFATLLSMNPDKFPCIPWNFQNNVQSWDLQVANPGTTLGNNPGSLVAHNNITDTPGGSGTASFGSFTGTGPLVNQFCGPQNSLTNTNPYCAWQPTLPGGPFIWAIRADYTGSNGVTSGHHGPWSSPFAGTWPAKIVVPSLIGESVSTADTNIQNAGLIACDGTGLVGQTSSQVVTGQSPSAGASATAGNCVSLTWTTGAGGGGTSYSTINVENCTSDQSSFRQLYT
jgi:hypothetical protein